MSKKRKGKSGKKVSEKYLEKDLTDLMLTQDEALSLAEIVAALKADAVAVPLKKLVFGLVQSNYLIRDEEGKFSLHPRFVTVEAEYQQRRRSTASIVYDGIEYPIGKKHRGNALDGDKVLARLILGRKASSTEAIIVKVIERAREEFFGVFQDLGRHGFVETERLGVDFFIRKEHFGEAKDGERVKVKMLHWRKNDKNPTAEILETFGLAEGYQSSMSSQLQELGIGAPFSKEIEDIAKTFTREVTAEDVKERRDMRDILTLTIDPKDAKDFDDALSYRLLSNGNIELGVHIADVTYYLDKSSALDREARNRATSIYLVDKVIPMLPEYLSNDLCSLNPKEDKRTYSVVFELTTEGEIVSYEIGRTLIHSDYRFTYEEAQERIETGKGTLGKEMQALWDLASQLRDKRHALGAIDFDREEVKFILNEENKPVDVYFKRSLEANKLIEECMLLANKTVGEHVGKTKRKKPKTFIYRIHERPSGERIENFVRFAEKIGLDVNPSEDSWGNTLNTLLGEQKGTAYSSSLETLAMRTMQKARYSTVNLGHFGLQFKHYSHFTSPIRRYPDVIAHRLLEEYSRGGESANSQEIERWCKHCSEQERLAMEAERASIKHMQVQFLENKIGEEFDAVISGIQEYGIYAEIIENKVEGMVRIADVRWDLITAVPNSLYVESHRMKKIYRFGDTIRVKVKRVNSVKRQIDFEWVAPKKD